MKFGIITIVLCFYFINLYATDYPVTTYLGIDQGLSNNSVRCIYQDRRGFMWFGTYDGLNRYDGYSFKVFRNNFRNATSLINNWINTIDEDKQGNLWVGTRQGVCVYRSASDQFADLIYIGLKKTVEPVKSVIRDIERDADGNMFVGTADVGLLFFAKGGRAGIQVQLENVREQPKVQDVAFIKKGSGKQIWVFVRGKGLCLYDYATQKLRIVNSTVTSANCLETADNIIWVGTPQGIYQYNRLTNTYDIRYGEENGLTNRDIIGLRLDSHGKLWCATNGGGISVIDSKTGAYGSVTAGKGPADLTSNSVYAIWEDPEARMWIGSLRGGINVIDPHRKLFQTVVADPAASNTLISNYIFSFYEDPTGDLLIGTDGDGLSVWDRKKNRFTNYKHNAVNPASLSNDFITNIKSDYAGNVWVATYKGGINTFNKEKGTFQQYPFLYGGQKMMNPLAYAVLEDKIQNFWVSSLPWGLYLFNRDLKLFELFDDRLKDLFELFEDKQGVLWGGNLSQLIQVDRVNKKHTYYNVGKPVRAIHEDKAGNLWVGTEGGGLILFDRVQHTIAARFTTDEGLCSNSVLNMLEDDSGNVWISTFNGISKFQVKSRTFSNYFQSDGLQSNQFNYNAALKLRTGELVFGGIKGFTLFNPAAIVGEATMPKISFTGIKIGNKPIEQVNGFIAKMNGNDISAIRVPFDEAVLSIEFAALEYSAPDKIQYAYYLEGWDRGWNYTNNNRSATYTHLSEGNYTLRVKCTNAGGVWGARELTIDIVVLPPWYRSWWAYLLYVALASGFVYSYIKYRTKQTRLKYEVAIANLNTANERAEREKGEAELARERAEREREHAELEKERIVVEKEKEMHEKKISFFTNISHEFRTPLTLIINPIRDLLKKKEIEQPHLESELSVVYRNAHRMLSLVDQLLLFRKAESDFDKIHPAKLNVCHLAREVYLCFLHPAKARNINYTFECEEEHMELVADRQKLEIILYNLISNAIKYTEAEGTIALRIQNAPDNEHIIIEVEDTGAGIPAAVGEKLFEKFYQPDRVLTTRKPGFGIGLFLVKHFTDEHKGTIAYKSEEGKGTLFTLRFLKGSAHFGEDIKIIEEPTAPPFADEGIDNTALEESPASSAGIPATDVVTEKKTVLLIEDDEAIRQYLSQLFASTYIVLQAPSGEAGLEMAQQYLPDLIISDIHMKALSGIELCKQIKEQETTSHIPVILLTGSTSDALKLQGIEEGADDYISKPFDSQLLTARVSSLLRSRSNLQKYFYNEITLHKSNLKISPEYKEFLEKCIKIVESHLEDENFTVKNLLAEMGMSHSNLFRKVKSISGLSVNVFIRFIRLRKAAELFVSTDYNVNETAFMVGIKDAKYFREQFNKLFKMNPSEYIKKYRGVYRNQYTVNKPKN
jgi:signal transduction histidine kinase/ligand-binding sensor domain-containing protein/DNA-binding response OmpR family regulator